MKENHLKNLAHHFSDAIHLMNTAYTVPLRGEEINAISSITNDF